MRSLPIRAEVGAVAAARLLLVAPVIAGAGLGGVLVAIVHAYGTSRPPLRFGNYRRR